MVSCCNQIGLNDNWLVPLDSPILTHDVLKISATLQEPPLEWCQLEVISVQFKFSNAITLLIVY